MTLLSVNSIFLVSLSLFARTYGGGDVDEPRSVSPTSDGGFVLAGHTISFGAGNYDFLILKIFSNGTLDWARTFGGASYDYPYSVIQTSDGGFAVAGYTRSFGVGNYDLLILKLLSDGSLDWARTFGGTNVDYAYSLIQTSDGGFAIAGSTASFGAGGQDIFVLRLFSNGSLDWARTFGGSNADIAHSLIQTSDGGFAIAGETYSFSANGRPDFLVLKLSANGSLDWARVFGDTANNYAYSIVQTSDGGFAVAGGTTGSGTGSDDFLVLKLLADGSRDWARTYGRTYVERAYSIIQTPDGGLAVVGETGAWGDWLMGFLIVKLSSGGSRQWSKAIGARPGVCSAFQTSDNRFVIAGTRSGTASELNFFLVAMDQNGVYVGCVNDHSVTEGIPVLVDSSVSLGASCSPDPSTPNPTQTTPDLTTVDICEPMYEDVGEAPDKGVPALICSSVPGGLMFASRYEVAVKIYYPDGRVAYSGDLGKGQNRIPLETGAYIWMAGGYKGKAIVR